MDVDCNALKDTNDHRKKAELERLADQVFELHHNIQNFEEAVAYAKEQLAKPHLTPLKETNLLKTLIIAKKQLRSRLPIVARKHEIFRLLDKGDLIILEG
jgi:hypothetical protein